MRTARREDGYTIVEALIVAAILVVVLAATLALLDKTSAMLPGDDERAQVVDEARVGLHRVTRDLRQAYRLVSAPAVGGASDRIEFEVQLQGVDQRVGYDCSLASSRGEGLRRCLRTAVPLAGGPARSSVVIDGVAGGPVFERREERFFAVRVEVPAKGERSDARTHRAVLDDGVLVRNLR